MYRIQAEINIKTRKCDVPQIYTEPLLDQIRGIRQIAAANIRPVAGASLAHKNTKSNQACCHSVVALQPTLGASRQKTERARKLVSQLAVICSEILYN